MIRRTTTGGQRCCWRCERRSLALLSLRLWLTIHRRYRPHSRYIRRQSGVFFTPKLLQRELVAHTVGQVKASLGKYQDMVLQFAQKLRRLRKLPREVRRELCCSMEYERFEERGAVVFSRGDPVDKVRVRRPCNSSRVFARLLLRTIVRIRVFPA